MNKKVMWGVIVLFIILILVGVFFNNTTSKVDKFYASLEKSISDKIKEVKYNFENNNLLEGRVLSIGKIEDREYMDDPGKTFYSNKYKYTIVNDGETYAKAKGYDITFYLKNKSGYDLFFDMVNIEDGSLKDDVYLKNNESINLSSSLWSKNGDGYNTDNLMANEDVYIKDKIKFKYEGRYIELPIEINMSFNIYGDKKSIKKVSVSSIKGIIHSDDENLINEIKLVVGENTNTEEDIRNINVELNSN